MKIALKIDRYFMYQSIWNEYKINTGTCGTLTDVYLHLKLHCTDNHRYTYIAASNTKSIL